MGLPVLNWPLNFIVVDVMNLCGDDEMPDCESPQCHEKMMIRFKDVCKEVSKVANNSLSKDTAKAWITRMATIFGICVSIVIGTGVTILIAQGQADHKYATKEQYNKCSEESRTLQSNQQHFKETMNKMDAKQSEMDARQRMIFKAVGEIKGEMSGFKANQKAILKSLERLEDGR